MIQDAETGTIFLADGTCHSADLVIGADGIHVRLLRDLRRELRLMSHKSRIREVFVPNEVVVKHSGYNAYRFMGSTKDLEMEPQTKALLESKRNTWTGFMVG